MEYNRNILREYNPHWKDVWENINLHSILTASNDFTYQSISCKSFNAGDKLEMETKNVKYKHVKKSLLLDEKQFSKFNKEKMLSLLNTDGKKSFYIGVDEFTVIGVALSPRTEQYDYKEIFPECFPL